MVRIGGVGGTDVRMSGIAGMSVGVMDGGVLMGGIMSLRGVPGLTMMMIRMSHVDITMTKK